MTSSFQTLGSTERHVHDYKSTAVPSRPKVNSTASRRRSLLSRIGCVRLSTTAGANTGRVLRPTGAGAKFRCYETRCERALSDDAELGGGGAPASSTLCHALVRAGVTGVHQTDRQRRSTRVDRDSTRLRPHSLPCHTRPQLSVTHASVYRPLSAVQNVQYLLKS